ncbi:MAG: glutaredoxin family protein, partial [Bradyrhizobium sp.]
MSVTSLPAVTVYSTDTCPWCDRAKTYLKAN